MVSFRPHGRLGNYLFMCSNAIAYALEHDLTFSAPKSTDNTKWNPIYLPHLQYEDYKQGREDILINETQFNYKPHEFREEWRDNYVIFNGYFQSESYFEKYRDEILYLFGLPWELKPMISLHARFGDYLTIHGKHIIVNEPYIREGLAILKEKTGIDKVKVFSDDLEYFKQHFGHIQDFEYSTNTDEIADLVEISCCHSHLNSSSTFSWWGAYLNRNPDKVVVTHEKWFQTGHGGHDTSTIIPDEWIKLPLGTNH